LTGAAVGFAGPVGFSGKLVVDRDAASVSDGVTGANETDYHLLHVAYGRDFEGLVADIRSVEDGDLCPECGANLNEDRGHAHESAPDPRWTVSVAVPETDRLGPAARELLSYLDEPVGDAGVGVPVGVGASTLGAAAAGPSTAGGSPAGA